jgi:hypothetical protein
MSTSENERNTILRSEELTNEPDFRYALVPCVAVRGGLYIWGCSTVVAASRRQMPRHMSKVHECEAHGQAQAQGANPKMGELWASTPESQCQRNSW